MEESAWGSKEYESMAVEIKARCWGERDGDWRAYVAKLPGGDIGQGSFLVLT